MSKNPESKNNSDDDFMILMCGNTYGVVDFKLPTPPNGKNWQVVFDTADTDKKIAENGTYPLDAYSYVLLTSKQDSRDNMLLMQKIPAKKFQGR